LHELLRRAYPAVLARYGSIRLRDDILDAAEDAVLALSVRTEPAIAPELRRRLDSRRATVHELVPELRAPAGALVRAERVAALDPRVRETSRAVRSKVAVATSV
jgi:hypothetical protein